MSKNWCKRSEDTLHSLEKAIETMQLGVTITDTNGEILYTNPAEAKMHGYKVTDLIGKDVRIFAHNKLWKYMTLEQMKEIKSWRRESANIRKDGSIFPVQLLSDIVTNASGDPIRIVTTSEDITKRKQVEEKIERDYHIQKTISSILRISMEPITLREQLGRILDLILAIPWLSLQSKGCIYLVEDAPEALVMKAQRGLPESLLTTCTKVPFGTCLCGQAASTREIVFTDSIDDRHDIRHQGIPPHGHYCVPILSDYCVLGVINLYVGEGHRRDQGEEEFLSAVANTLAGIIKRKQAEDALRKTKAELALRVKERTSELTLANEQLQKDIIERKRMEEQIKRSLGEKEMLLKEIHHRVKNNLQVISSLLKFQSGYVQHKEYVEMLKDSQNRIKSMALIHEQLYQSKDLANIHFHAYVKSLANSLFMSYGANIKKVALKTDISDVSLGIDTAIPCGLIINELISNSLKHAFPEDRRGQIKIVLRSGKDEIELIVSDNGVGIPEDLDFKETESIGLKLITNLAEKQLHGIIKLNRKKGTEFQILFKKISYKERI